MPPSDLIQADFDRIALLADDDWNHNDHYHGFLLDRVPPHYTEALEIGCGTGAFSRLLARRADQVLALDLSPGMIEIARNRSGENPNIDFQVADVTTWTFPAERFDCVASIATLHHLPMAETLTRVKETLKPGGALIVLDLYQAAGPADVFVSVLARPAHIVLRLIRTGRLREPPAVQNAWAEHGRHDSYLTLPQIRAICAAVLPGARVRRHLLWRYSIVWNKPGL